MTDLVTNDDYKQYKGITGSADDGKLDFIIPAVSALVKNYCGRSFIDFYTTDKVEYFSFRTKQGVVFLDEIPVLSITSVKEWDVDYGVTYDTLLTTEWVLDKNLDAIYRVFEGTGKRIDFPLGINAVEVTYKGGYSATPADLKIAILDLVEYYLKQGWKPEMNINQINVRNVNADPSFPDHIKRVLDLYREQ